MLDGTVIMSFKLTIGRTAITSDNIYTNEAISAFLNKSKIYVNSDYLHYIGGYRTKRVVLNADRTR